MGKCWPVRDGQMLSTELCPWLVTIVMLRVTSEDQTRVRRKGRNTESTCVYILEYICRKTPSRGDINFDDCHSPPLLSHSQDFACGPHFCLISLPSLCPWCWESLLSVAPQTHPTSCFSLQRRVLHPMSSAGLSISPGLWCIYQ